MWHWHVLMHMPRKWRQASAARETCAQASPKLATFCSIGFHVALVSLKLVLIMCLLAVRQGIAQARLRRMASWLPRSCAAATSSKPIGLAEFGCGFGVELNPLA